MPINSSLTIPGAGPFYFEGNKIGILLIHGGGGGTCSDLKPLAKDLHMIGGYTISVPLLPGYGTTPDELRKIRIDDWKSALKKEFLGLLNRCEKIIVGGHSMGGILTLLLASNYNANCIFLINAPVGIQRFLFHLVPLFKIFVKYHAINSEQFRKDTNGNWVGYDKIPLNIAIKMKKLMKEMKRSLLNISCPTLIFQGRRDSEIKANSMDYIFSNIKSKTKRKIWLENNGHPILKSPDHNQIVLEVVKFINEFCT
ncbi:MAG: alpha/beta fold hydrolase [Promethearchaeota archaeon]|nr:MAG: alpha/beta fold hydrolase [Candidatus Lokiarchaeota archaeon]